jgi:hypothetical protein
MLTSIAVEAPLSAKAWIISIFDQMAASLVNAAEMKIGPEGPIF